VRDFDATEGLVAVEEAERGRAAAERLKEEAILAWEEATKKASDAESLLLELRETNLELEERSGVLSGMVQEAMSVIEVTELEKNLKLEAIYSIMTLVVLTLLYFRF